MATAKTSKHPKPHSRSWAQILVLVVPLTIVGVSAMAISYLTLIDVARVNGLPLPELFPVLVDVGTVTCMIVAAQVRSTGRGSGVLAYLTFIGLSAISVLANMSHATRAADLLHTTLWAAMILAATPPAALLAITHLVMTLIPDERERKVLAARHATLVSAAQATVPASVASTNSAPVAAVAPVTRQTTPARVAPAASLGEEEARAWVQGFVADHGVKPTGAQMEEALHMNKRTAQRRLGEWFPNDEGLFPMGLRAVASQG